MARAPPPLLAPQRRNGPSSLARLPAEYPELRALRLLATVDAINPSLQVSPHLRSSHQGRLISDMVDLVHLVSVFQTANTLARLSVPPTQPTLQVSRSAR